MVLKTPEQPSDAPPQKVYVSDFEKTPSDE